MRWRTMMHLFGILLMLYSLSFIPSVGIALGYADGQHGIFIKSFLITLVLGAILWFPNRGRRSEPSIRDGFLIVALFWFILGVAGSLPFLLGLHLDFTDAIFESVSGFTTTGSTVISGLDELPRSILYHRQQIQWFGGMGIIVLAVAILPLLGIGGMQLYEAEASTVAMHEKMTPRIKQTARALWLIYLLLTVVCALGYWAAGMKLFDAVGHAFTTVATGGFSTHDASLGFYDSPVIETIAIVFMLAGGVNFAVHFFAVRRLTMNPYVADPEVRTFGFIFLLATLWISIGLFWTRTCDNSWESLRFAAFEVASVLTSTGYATATFSDWPLHLPLSMVVLSFIGGCAGSTAGGIKVIRVLLLTKLGVREMFQLAHPQAVTVVKLGDHPVENDVLFSVWGFFVLYLVVAMMLTLAMMAAGLDLETAFGAVVATINLLGPGLGGVADTFAAVSPVVKWLAVFAMLIGRLEVFTLLILFLPSYWRH